MKAPLTCGASIAATLFLCLPATAQFTFAPTTSYPAGTQPSGVAAGDFDGDGDIDLATTSDAPDRVVVLLNSGIGAYVAGPSSNLPNSSSPQDLIAGDFNGDTIMDLAVAVRDPQGSVVFMRGLGGALFTNAGTTIVGDRPRGFSVADIEGDGDFDIAVANRDSSSASVLTNNGSGVFTAATLAVGGETRDTALADFDADGDLDLAVSNRDGNTVAIFTRGLVSFTPSMTLAIGGVVRPDGVEWADLDNDGDMDIAAATSDASLGINRATIFIRAGAGFNGPVNYAASGSNGSAIVIADLDCDGLRDVAIANQDSANVSLLRNVGAGAFGAAQLLTAGTTPSEMVAGDFDGDGDSDLATANRDSNNVSVMVNDTCTPCPEDLDGNASVGFSDLTQLLITWGPCPSRPQGGAGEQGTDARCAADIDGNGDVGFSDLTLLLVAWGACP